MAYAAKDMGYNRIYVCGRKAYDNELAMFRHEGRQGQETCTIETVFDVHPRFAYRISHGQDIMWVTDPVEVALTRRHTPEAQIDVVEVIR